MKKSPKFTTIRTMQYTTQTTTISFVRHGQVHNPQKIYYGGLPRFRLSENGRMQAATTATHLAAQQVDVIYTSPLLRARQTAGIISERIELPVHTSALLREVHTPYDGQPQEVMERRDWDGYTDSPPEFEQPTDVVQRLTRFISQVRQRHVGQHVTAVTHADPIAFTALWAAGQPCSIPARRHLMQVGLPVNYPTHAGVLTLAFNGYGERPYQITYFDPMANGHQ
ncbi:MAG: histidine phosphatase family protein [Ardenticatenaceae bacterium]|nr:histidine phosphatase family protein [Anaerolineales bacterium]MCB8920263.1 histidine phosphatase family protein [Ardenticatenaceae bacterium]